MKHSFFDKYSYLETSIHKTQPVVKILFFLIFAILLIVFSEWSFLTHLVGFFIVTTIIYFSRIPPLFIIKRIFEIFPFILIITLSNFFAQFPNYHIILKTIFNSSLIIIALILLIQTTKFHQLLYGLAKLGVPKIIIILLSFIYRYFFVLIDEIEKMTYSVKIRSYKRINIKTLANIVGILFIRSYERAERIYSAMIMRGFNSEAKFYESH